MYMYVLQRFDELERCVSCVMAKSRNSSKEQEQELSGLLSERS